MEQCRRTAHSRFDIKFHLVWTTKCRRKQLRADVGIRLRQSVRDTGSELEVEIIEGQPGPAPLGAWLLRGEGGRGGGRGDHRMNPGR